MTFHGINDKIYFDENKNIGIGITNPSTNFHIDSTDGIVIPVGTSAQRVDVTGAIRYNTDNATFEGFKGTWGSLGGIIDVDQDTYIEAETSAGTDNDDLKFFTSGTERMKIDSNGNTIINSDLIVDTNLLFVDASSNLVNINGDLDIWGKARFESVASYIESGVLSLSNTLTGPVIDSTGTDIRLSSTGNTGALTINSSGNTSLTGTLSMGDNNINTIKQIKLDSDTVTNKLYLTRSDNSVNGFVITQSTGQVVTLNQSENANMNLSTNNITRLRLEADGDINCMSNNIKDVADITLSGNGYISGNLNVTGQVGVGMEPYIYGAGTSNEIPFELTVKNYIKVDAVDSDAGSIYFGNGVTNGIYVSGTYWNVNFDRPIYSFNGTEGCCVRTRYAQLGLKMGNQTPSIDFAISDVDTGLNSEGTDELGVYTGGTEQLRFTNSGITLKCDIIPDIDNAYDIGSAEFKIRDMYVSDNSLWVGDSHKVSISDGKMKFRKRKSSSVPAAVTAAGGDEDGALSHSGKSSLINMKLKHWKKYMRSLSGQSTARIQDIFRDNDADYDEQSAADNWLENGTKTYCNIGNVGIGTNNPGDKLHIYENANDSIQLKIENAYASSRAGISLVNGSTTFNIQCNGPQAIFENYGSGGTHFYQKGSTDGYTFRTTDSNIDRFIIKTGGWIGMGCSPNESLEIEDISPMLRLTDSRSNYGDASGVELGGIEFYSRDGSMGGDYAGVAKIKIVSDNGSVAPDGAMVFLTGVNGVLSERMRLPSGGNLEVSGNIEASGYIVGRQHYCDIQLQGSLNSSSGDLYKNKNQSQGTWRSVYLSHTRTDESIPKVGMEYDYNRSFAYNYGFDDSNTNNSTNANSPNSMYQLKCSKSGIYIVNYNIKSTSTSNGAAIYGRIRVNGSGNSYAYSRIWYTDAGKTEYISGSDCIYMNANDYLEIETYCHSGTHTYNGGRITACLIGEK